MATLNNTPDYTNAAYKEMAPAWDFLSDVLAGQDTIKAAKEKYLPKEFAEMPEDYNRRLDRSLFFEDYRDCVVNLTGTVFRKPPTLSTDVPVEIRGLEEATDDDGNVTQLPREGLAENIDNAGTHLDVFLQRVFQDAFFGHSFIVVEMPGADPNVRSAADEKGRRAYWCMRHAKDALNWRTSIVNGQTVLSQITFKECTMEAEGAFGEKEVTRYRVYRLNEQGNAEWQLWRETEKPGIQTDKEIILEDSGLILKKKGGPLRRLPVAIHYGEHEGFLRSRPPLRTIADINLAYYQKYSDLSNIEHFTCAVTLCIIGEDPNTPEGKTLGGNRVIYVPPGGDAKFLEVDGDSIPALERDLECLQKRLVAKGLDFLQDEHYVPPTATEVVLAYTQRTSKLARMVRSLIDAAEEALDITAEMEGLEQGGSLTLGVDENSLSLSPEQIRIYSEMNERGQLSLQTLWSILNRADQMPDNFDAVEELKRVEAAALKQMELNAKQFDAGNESTP